jgi:AcrR family transcriptional regulator
MRTSSKHPLQTPSTAAEPSDVSEVRLGLRERHKLDKLRRIRSSARKVFLEKGFDGATTREVAELAGVSHATVFLYAQDKRDLLFLVFNEDVDRVAQEAFGAVDPTKPLVDQLMALFGPFYRYFGHDPQVGLLGIHEYGAAAVGETPQMLRVQQRADAIHRAICATVDSCKAAGTVGPRTSTATAALVIRAVYFAEMDSWLRTKVQDVDVGLKSLRSALRLVFVGLQARE